MFCLIPKIFTTIKLDNKLVKVEFEIDLVKDKVIDTTINYGGIDTGTPTKVGSNVESSFNNFVKKRHLQDTIPLL